MGQAKHLSNTTATGITISDVPSVRCRLLQSNTGFLQRVIGKRAKGLRKLVVDSFSDGICLLCLVQESRELMKFWKPVSQRTCWKECRLVTEREGMRLGNQTKLRFC